LDFYKEFKAVNESGLKNATVKEYCEPYLTEDEITF
jgi:hypothetical protein